MKPLIGAGGTTSRDPDEALIARLSTLAPALDGEPDPEWQASMRTRLVAMAAVRTPEPEPVSPLRRLLARREGPRPIWRTRLTAGLAGAAAAVTGLATVVALSADAQPGDALYGFKRGTEQTQLALAGDARGRTLLGFASTRLDELSVVLADEPAADLVADTLATMDAQTADGSAWLAQRALETGTSAPLDELAGWSAGQSAGLAELRSAMPSDARDDAADSADLLAGIDERIDALRVALDCPSGPATDGTDRLGPVPVECTAAAPGPSVGGGSDPAAPGVGEPGTPAEPTPGSPTGGTDEPGGAPGSGGSEGTGGADPDSGPGTDGPGLPGVDPTLPEAPEVTDLPDLPTPIPSPSVTLRPPPLGNAGGSPAPNTSGGTGAGTGEGLLPEVCLPPLIVC